jgi:DNA integrity scanning protein DisA with diadenylate cyclase activity
VYNQIKKDKKMLSKAKEIFSCCTSNNYVALPTEIPVKIKDKNDKANIKRTIPKSIFELGHPDNHRAVILNNQELFKSIQADTVAILDDYVENMPRFDAIKKNLYDKTATYSVHDFIQTHSKERTITRKLRQFSDVLIKQLENQQKNKRHLS